jgi:hypothetical protein
MPQLITIAMKKLFTIIAVIGLATALKAQIAEGTAVLNRVEQPAVVAEFNYSPEVVEAVLMDDMKYRGFGKGSETKGFHKFEGILFPYLSGDKIDYYFKVSEKNKEKGKSIVSVIISKGGGTFVSSAYDPAIMDSTKAYLNGFSEAFEQKKLDFDIDSQRDIIAKEEKKYQKLVGDGETMVTKLKNLEADIEKNNQEQAKQKAVLDKEKQLLETLKSQKK